MKNVDRKTLFGDRDKIAVSLARIKEFEPMAVMNNPAGYYVCVSGGKDSSVIQELCVMAGVKCEFVHNHTSVDYPETVRFIRREKKRLEELGHAFRVEIPRFKDGRQKTMWNLTPMHGLPARAARWRCRELKEGGGGGEGRYCVTGIRWEESAGRKKRGLHEEKTREIQDKIVLNNDNDMKRRLAELCVSKRSFFLNPVIDWTKDDVWEFIRKYKLPYNPLYDMGFNRVGCVGCPMNSKMKQELAKNPKYKEAYFRAAKRRWERRIERGLDCGGIFETPEKYFEVMVVKRRWSRKR